MMNNTEYKKIDERIYYGVSKSGLRVNVIPKKGFNGFYAVFAADYGGAMRKFTVGKESFDTPAGVAHYLEHKMFDMPDGDNALTTLTNNGADPNAFTSSDMTAYYFQCTDKFEENLRLLLRFVSTPYFTDETVEKERGIIAQEILMGEDNPGMKIYYNLLGLLYEHHPLKDRVAGTVESISHITADTLYRCHRAFYCPDNMALCVEGDVDPERIMQIVEEEITEPYRTAPTPDYGKAEKLTPAAAIKRETMPVSAPQFLIGAKFKPEKSGRALLRQDLISSLAMRMLAGHSSPFYTRLYRQGLLNRDFDYEVDFTTGTGTIIIGGESSDPTAVLEEFKRELERVAEEGFDERSFMLAKRATVGARLRGLEDFENVCIAVVSGVFDGYKALDSVEMSESITKGECEKFIAENLPADRLAISIIESGDTEK